MKFLSAKRVVQLSLFYVVVVALQSCTSFPSDPEHSLKHIRDSVFRVGYMHAPPWVIKSDTTGALTGIEVDIVNGLARRFNAEVEWIEGPQHVLMTLLEANQLHLVVGGITKETPWKAHVGLTNPYRKENIIVCHTEERTLTRINGKEVAVRRGSSMGAYVRNKRATPVEVDSIRGQEGLIAVYEQDKALCACEQCHRIIKTEEHVLAVPKGENALLMEIEKYLNEKGY